MNAEFNRAVGQRISRLRIGKKYTRERLAEAVDISDRFLYDIESGRKGCSAEILCRLSKALGVSADYLLTGDGVWPGDRPILVNIVQILAALPTDSLPYAEQVIEAFASYTVHCRRAEEQSEIFYV